MLRLAVYAIFIANSKLFEQLGFLIFTPLRIATDLQFIAKRR
jgi:hypothetical protein